MTADAAAPSLTVVIPIHDEEGIVERSVSELLSELRQRPWPFEIILAENGSHDSTRDIAKRLSIEHESVRVVTHPEADYGTALRLGISAAAGTFVVCDEIDLCNLDFYDRALRLLETDAAEVVVGSKVCAGARDHRPWLRRAGTRAISFLLRTVTGYPGTDTHGLKALRRARLLPIVARCVTTNDLFASELLVRADRAGLRVVEIPIDVREKRPPTKGLLRRVPRALLQLAQLGRALRTEQR